MANQFTKAAEEGREPPKADNQFTSGGGSKGPKKEHDPATRDKIRAELLAQRLYRFANSKAKNAEKHAMSSAQVAAAKVLVDKGKPSLQAVEQTNSDPLEAMSQNELEDMVRALITADPTLLQRLNLTPKPALVSQDESSKAA